MPTTGEVISEHSDPVMGMDRPISFSGLGINLPIELNWKR